MKPLNEDQVKMIKEFHNYLMRLHDKYWGMYTGAVLMNKFIKENTREETPTSSITQVASTISKLCEIEVDDKNILIVNSIDIEDEQTTKKAISNLMLYMSNFSYYLGNVIPFIIDVNKEAKSRQEMDCIRNYIAEIIGFITE